MTFHVRDQILADIHPAAHSLNDFLPTAACRAAVNAAKEK